MSEITSDLLPSRSIAQKTVQGAFSLGVRQVLVQGTKIAASIVLARILTPAQFGIYAIILFTQTFLISFGDAGLAGSLIRQHAEPEVADYQAIFTVQQMLVIAFSILLWVSSPWIAFSYHLQPNEAWLFRLVALSFFFTSFMVIPQVRLERELEFHKIAMVDSAQAIVFNGLAVLLAWLGFGAYSFAWALLARAILGSALTNWISPWKIGWQWDWPRVKSHMSFGIPYQGIQAVSLLKDSITPILVGLLLGTKEVGYLSWAAMTAAYPVMALMVLQRVYMPAFARLQHNSVQLIALVENIIWATNAIVAPLAVITLVLIRPITSTIYGDKWLVALPYFYFLWLANLFVPTATPSLSLLNALGKSKIALFFAVIWMAGTWVIGAPLILRYGAIGFVVANLIVQLSSIWLYKAAQKCVHFDVLRVIFPIWLIAGCCGAFLYAACHLYYPHTVLNVALYGSFGLFLYALSLYIFFKGKLHNALQSLRRSS
jgi:O-antigen/teichoic acid export membrane protein